MKNVSKIIPCYAADTSGVCSALYELGGLTVVHDASGCNSTYSTHDEPRWYDVRSKIYISALTELDAVMGNDEKMISDIVSAAKDQSPEFIALCGSPMPMMTGFDYDSAAAEIEERSGIKTIPLHTNGMRSYIEGASESLEAVIKAFCRNTKKTEGLGVNVLGMTPLDFPLGTDTAIKKWIEKCGFRFVSNLAMGSSFQSIKNASQANVNLVVSYSGMAAARYMKKYLDIPYVVGVPFGKGYADRLREYIKNAAESREKTSSCFPEGRDNTNSDTVIIGESISAVSMANSLLYDMGVNAKVICTLPTEKELLSDSDTELSAEEDIEAYLKNASPSTVIADPLYKYLLPKGTTLIEIPHFAFSGRCFQKDMRVMINCDISELFK